MKYSHFVLAIAFSALFLGGCAANKNASLTNSSSTATEDSSSVAAVVVKPAAVNNGLVRRWLMSEGAICSGYITFKADGTGVDSTCRNYTRQFTYTANAGTITITYESPTPYFHYFETSDVFSYSINGVLNMKYQYIPISSWHGISGFTLYPD